ncbi:pectinesterase inhibitor 11-like [Cucurbita maxima]|uniref:Pectinesterase inhibitor 11-like n=1 Tax=Cucurbita maxima TaxID=3661 RepID=A0A6J1JZX9_CUCMA|nr:pectinesterase inhibitor 11-like [Cucurbita maxima]
MAKSAFLLLLLSISTLFATTSAAGYGGASNFIKSRCNFTTYPDLCVQSLTNFASRIQQSPRQLVQTALTVSLSHARSARSFVWKLTKFTGLKPREYAALRDCLEEVGDTVERLSKSVEELKLVRRSKRRDFEWHISNVETWVSAAMTDGNTCSDGFAGAVLNGRIKSSIRRRIVDLTRFISNALALINNYAQNQS